MVDQPLLNFHGQNNVNAWNNNTSSVRIDCIVLIFGNIYVTIFAEDKMPKINSENVYI